MPCSLIPIIPSHSALRQKSCAAVQPDAPLVTMVILNNATAANPRRSSATIQISLRRCTEMKVAGKMGQWGFVRCWGSSSQPPLQFKHVSRTRAAPAADSNQQLHTAQISPYSRGSELRSTWCKQQPPAELHRPIMWA